MSNVNDFFAKHGFQEDGSIPDTATLQPKKNTLTQHLGDLGVAALKGGVSVGQGAVGLANLVTGGLAGETLGKIGYDSSRTNEAINALHSDQYLRGQQAVQQAGEGEGSQLDKGFATLGALYDNPMQAAGAVVESLPLMAPGLAWQSKIAKEALAAGGAKALANASGKMIAVGAGMEGAQQAGSLADRAQNEGKDYYDYALPAIASGVGDAAISTLSGHVLGDAATNLLTRAAGKEIKGNMATRFLRGAATEGLAEELPQSMQEQYFQNVADGKQDKWEGVGAAGAQGLVAGGLMGGFMNAGALTKAASAGGIDTTTTDTNQITPDALAQRQAELETRYAEQQAQWSPLDDNTVLDTLTGKRTLSELKDDPNLSDELISQNRAAPPKIEGTEHTADSLYRNLIEPEETSGTPQLAPEQAKDVVKTILNEQSKPETERRKLTAPSKAGAGVVQSGGSGGNAATSAKLVTETRAKQNALIDKLGELRRTLGATEKDFKSLNSQIKEQSTILKEQETGLRESLYNQKTANQQLQVEGKRVLGVHDSYSQAAQQLPKDTGTATHSIETDGKQFFVVENTQPQIKDQELTQPEPEDTTPLASQEIQSLLDHNASRGSSDESLQEIANFRNKGLSVTKYTNTTKEEAEKGLSNLERLNRSSSVSFDIIKDTNNQYHVIKVDSSKADGARLKAIQQQRIAEAKAKETELKARQDAQKKQALEDAKAEASRLQAEKSNAVKQKLTADAVKLIEDAEDYFEQLKKIKVENINLPDETIKSYGKWLDDVTNSIDKYNLRTLELELKSYKTSILNAVFPKGSKRLINNAWTFKGITANLRIEVTSDNAVAPTLSFFDVQSVIKLSGENVKATKDEKSTSKKSLLNVIAGIGGIHQDLFNELIDGADIENAQIRGVFSRSGTKTRKPLINNNGQATPEELMSALSGIDGFQFDSFEDLKDKFSAQLGDSNNAYYGTASDIDKLISQYQQRYEQENQGDKTSPPLSETTTTLEQNTSETGEVQADTGTVDSVSAQGKTDNEAPETPAQNRKNESLINRAKSIVEKVKPWLSQDVEFPADTKELNKVAQELGVWNQEHNRAERVQAIEDRINELPNKQAQEEAKKTTDSKNLPKNVSNGRNTALELQEGISYRDVQDAKVDGRKDLKTLSQTKAIIEAIGSKNPHIAKNRNAKKLAQLDAVSDLIAQAALDRKQAEIESTLPLAMLFLHLTEAINNFQYTVTPQTNKKGEETGNLVINFEHEGKELSFIMQPPKDTQTEAAQVELFNAYKAANEAGGIGSWNVDLDIYGKPKKHAYQLHAQPRIEVRERFLTESKADTNALLKAGKIEEVLTKAKESKVKHKLIQKAYDRLKSIFSALIAKRNNSGFLRDQDIQFVWQNSNGDVVLRLQKTPSYFQIAPGKENTKEAKRIDAARNQAKKLSNKSRFLAAARSASTSKEDVDAAVMDYINNYQGYSELVGADDLLHLFDNPVDSQLFGFSASLEGENDVAPAPAKEGDSEEFKSVSRSDNQKPDDTEGNEPTPAEPKPFSPPPFTAENEVGKTYPKQTKKEGLGFDASAVKNKALPVLTTEQLRNLLEQSPYYQKDENGDRFINLKQAVSDVVKEFNHLIASLPRNFNRAIPLSELADLIEGNYDLSNPKTNFSYSLLRAVQDLPEFSTFKKEAPEQTAAQKRQAKKQEKQTEAKPEQSPQATEQAAEGGLEQNTPDFNLSRGEFLSKYAGTRTSDKDYDLMLHRAYFNDEISKQHLEKNVIRDSIGNKEFWAKTRKEIEDEGKESVKSLRGNRAKVNKNELNESNWRVKSKSNTARKDIEFQQERTKTLLSVHKDRVLEAIEEGKPVPFDVLNDYPDLKVKIQQPTEKSINKVTHNGRDIFIKTDKDGIDWHSLDGKTYFRDDLEGKKAEIDREISRESAREKEREAEKKEADKKQSVLDYFSGFLGDLKPMQKGLKTKQLEKQAGIKNIVKPIYQHVESLVNDGAKTSTREENVIKDMSRMAYHRATNEQQAAHEKKQKAAGTKTIYLVGNYDLGKTAYDYANYLIDSKNNKQSNATAQPAPVAQQTEERYDPYKNILDEYNALPKELSVGEKYEKLPFYMREFLVRDSSDYGGNFSSEYIKETKFDDLPSYEKGVIANKLTATQPQPNAGAVEVAHIENGETEPATSQVIAESAQTADSKPNVSMKQAKVDLIAQIDKALEKAPTEKDTTIHRFDNGSLDYNDALKANQITFEVEGDGKFTVLNTKEGLQKFKAKVDKYFKTPGKAWTPTTTKNSKQSEAEPIISRYLKEAESALDYVNKGKSRNGYVNDSVTGSAINREETLEELKQQAIEALDLAIQIADNADINSEEIKKARQTLKGLIGEFEAVTEIEAGENKESASSDATEKVLHESLPEKKEGYGAGAPIAIRNNDYMVITRDLKTNDKGEFIPAQFKDDRQSLALVSKAALIWHENPKDRNTGLPDFKKIITAYPSNSQVVVIDDDGQAKLFAAGTDDRVFYYLANVKPLNKESDDNPAIIEEQAAPQPAPVAEQAKSQETSPAPYSIDDIDKKLASRAFNWTSFDPENRGESARQSYVGALDKLWSNLKGRYNNATPELQQEFTDHMEGVVKRFAQLYSSYLSSHSNVASTMIAGPANFNSDRNRKKSDAADNRMREAYEYLDKAENQLAKILRGKIDNSLTGELAEQEKKLETLKANQEKMKAANAALRKNDDAKLKELGFTDQQISDIKKPDSFGTVGFPSYTLTNNNANIKRVEGRVSDIKKRIASAKAQAKIQPEAQADMPFRMEQNAAENRLQLFFDGKPDEETRNLLKKAAFKWSPKNQAWQRQLTGNAIASANAIAEKLKADKPKPQFSKSPTPTTAHTTQSLKAEFKRQLDGKLGSGWSERLFATGKFEIQSLAQAQDNYPTLNLAGVQGFYDAKTDKTIFIAENIEQGKNLVGLALHEIGVHALELNKSSPEFQRLIENLARSSFRPAVKSAIDTALKSFGIKAIPKAGQPIDGVSREDVLHEIAAYLVENNPNLSVAQKIIQWFRNAIRALGKALPILDRAKWFKDVAAINEADIISMATSALRSATESLLFDSVARENEAAKTSYAGQRATNADKTALAKAVEMEQQGIDNETIRKETGWFLGMDDKWRFEIDDSKAALKWGSETSSNSDEYIDWIDEASSRNNGVPLGNVLSNKELFKQYPILNTFRVKVSSSLGGALANFQGDNKTITLKDPYSLGENMEEETLSNLLHEIQHAIQDIEGFARGGSVEGQRQDYNTARARLNFLENELEYKEAAKKMDDIWSQYFNDEISEYEAVQKTDKIRESQPVFDEIKAVTQKLRESDPNGMKSYKRLAGEIEARDTQARLTMTSEERRNATPYVSQGISKEDAIVRFGNGVAESRQQTPDLKQIFTDLDQYARNPASVRKAALEALEGNPNKDRIMYINDNIFDILGKLEKVEGFVIKC